MESVSGSTGKEGGPVAGAASAANAAAYITTERQKQELRRERDQLLLQLAEQSGGACLTQVLGVSPAVSRKMVASARARLSGRASLPNAHEISARRLRGASDRWAAADAHYE